ncbi:secondary thiamine-phosphate synthase enzyme YjbQ [Desulfobulbus sp.]|uniref:secondary thiamine-phosphate synthase enzyme YjbQ n=1 Tax=Desulfobulbus sp. TaxID=895 RepID=UPI00286ED4EA|nr:secondary thiamine-phosphate synthase enzyme YjbQ [Desulfobulbus sp.]
MPRGELTVATSRQLEMIDLTDRLQQVVGGIDDGVLHVYNPHTTAGLIINEGADPDVRRDILGALARTVPSDFPYRHSEGNSPAHLMTALTGSAVTVFIVQGRLQLGTWQRIFFCEFDGPRGRRVWWKTIAG